MRAHWSFYDPLTGQFADALYFGKEVEENTPRGLIAIPGIYDRLSQRVDLSSGAVVGYQPPQPSTDHEWDAEARRWRKRADVLQRESRERAARVTIVTAEQQQARAVREALLALLPNGPEKARLQAIDDDIAARRVDLEQATGPRRD